MTSKPKPLSAKDALFAAAYCENGFNATQAAITAGSKAKAAGQAGYELLKKPEVKAEIARLQSERFKKLHMSADEWAAEVAKVARSSMRNILHVTEAGDPYIDLNKATPEDLDALASAEIEDFVDRRERDDEGNVVARDVRKVKVKMHDKLRALELAGKHLGLLKERVEHSVDESFADMMMAARKRADGAR